MASPVSPSTLSWTPDKQHSDLERWICIYPAYINSKKTLAQGRKIARTRCIDNPTHQEIRDIISAAGFKVGVENKLYSRERSKELLYRGRIRVQLKNDDGTPCNSDLPTRDSLLYHLGDTIPKLKTRQMQKSTEQAPVSTAGAAAGVKGKKGAKRR